MPATSSGQRWAGTLPRLPIMKAARSLPSVAHIGSGLRQIHHTLCRLATQLLPATARFCSAATRRQVVESLFYMWRATREPRWRNMGWQMWRAIQVTRAAFSGVCRRTLPWDVLDCVFPHVELLCPTHSDALPLGGRLQRGDERHAGGQVMPLQLASHQPWLPQTAHGSLQQRTVWLVCTLLFRCRRRAMTCSRAGSCLKRSSTFGCCSLRTLRCR